MNLRLLCLCAAALRFWAHPLENLAGGGTHDEVSLLQLRATILDASLDDENDWEGDEDIEWQMLNPMEWNNEFAQSEVKGAFPSDAFTAFGSSMGKGKGAHLVGFGFQKCATTLVNNLIVGDFIPFAHHPKELHWLGSNEPGKCPGHMKKAAKTYANYITDCFGGIFLKPGQITKDFTPRYGSHSDFNDFVNVTKSMEGAAQKHHAEFRFVALLRDPVGRAISAMNMKRASTVYNTHVGSRLSDDMLDTMLMRKIESQTLMNGSGNSSVIGDGEYVGMLRTIVDAFPKNSVLLVNSAHLSEPAVWRRIYGHIGVPLPEKSFFLKQFEKQARLVRYVKNTHYRKARTAPYAPSEEVSRKLAEYYAPFNEELWEFLGTPKWW